MRHGGWFTLTLLLGACDGGDTDAPVETDTDETSQPTGETDTDVPETDVETDVIDTDPIIAMPMDVTITPAEPVAGEALNCEADTTKQTSYTWKVDGMASGVNGPTVLTDTTDAYQTWTCEALTVDGTLEGSADVEVGEDCMAHHTDGTASLSSVIPSGGSLLLRRLSRAFTVEAWVYRERDDVTEDLLYRAEGLTTAANRTDYGLRFTDDGNLLFITGGADDGCATLSVTAPAKEEWHHIAASWEPTSGTKRIFIDGTQAATCDSLDRPSSTLVPPVLYVGASLRVESLEATIDNPFQGSIDELRLSGVERYTAAFTPSTYHSDDADTIVLFHLNEQRTFSGTPDPYEGSPDASAQGWPLRLADQANIIANTRSVCDTVTAP